MSESKFLVIDDTPFMKGVDSWEYAGHPSTSYDVVTHPDQIPADVSGYAWILLDHQMPGCFGDVVARALVGKGYDPSRILSIASLPPRGYPEGVRWIGGRLSISYMHKVLRFMQGEIGWDEVTYY